MSSEDMDPQDAEDVIVSGPEHYVSAGYYAAKAVQVMSAAEADVQAAAVFAAIGQIHATLAVASATALREERTDIRDWRAVTGQEGR